MCPRPQNKIRTDDLHSTTKTNKLKDLAEKSLLCLAFKRTLNPIHVDNRQIRTRAHDFPGLKVENYIHTRYERSVQYRTFQVWSKADKDVKSCESYTTLKTLLKGRLELKIGPCLNIVPYLLSCHPTEYSLKKNLFITQNN